MMSVMCEHHVCELTVTFHFWFLYNHLIFKLNIALLCRKYGITENRYMYRRMVKNTKSPKRHKYENKISEC